VSRLCVTAVGPVEVRLVTALANALQRSLGASTAQLAGMAEAAYAFDPERRQYSSSLILNALAAARPAEAVRLVGLTESDLFIPMLTFIFGQAQLGGAVAVLSFARLRQEFYGLAPDPELLVERAHKEALHELGHTFGLVHCADKSCAMALATNIRQVDLKRARYCEGCRARVAAGVRNSGLAAERERG
jgi:archaemetzincin